MNPDTPFDLRFTVREVTAWGGLARLKRMLDGMGFKDALQSWLAHADITRLDVTLVRLFDWGHAAGNKAIVRLFQRFDQASANRVHASSYAWLFDKLRLNPITLDVDSTVLTRWGSQIEGGAKGYSIHQNILKRPLKPSPTPSKSSPASPAATTPVHPKAAAHR